MRGKLKDLIATGSGLSDFPWPETICDFEIRITRDGRWLYKNSPIERQNLCRLLATVLQRDAAGDYWLVTPGERGRIKVDDVPFVAVALQVENPGPKQKLYFRTNLDYWVCADDEHKIRMQDQPTKTGPIPYIHIRDRLEARIARSIFYQMSELIRLEERAAGVFYMIDSAGCAFSLGCQETPP